MKRRTPGKFGHTFANSGNPDETVSSGFLLFAQLINFFIPVIIIWIKQGRCAEFT